MSTKGKDAEIFNLGAILLNIPGQEYIFGRTDTPGNPGEHFILCPFPNVEIRHCKISVDDEGEFWIEDLSSHSGKTSINREPLQGKKKLNFGDKISLQGTETTQFVYFEFEECQVVQNEKRITPFPEEATDVGNNHVLVKLILEHFSVKELKEYRFVSKPWNSAASQLLRKRCAISIPASDPHEQTKLFRCAKEMETFSSNMTSLSVEIPTFPPDLDGDKDAEKFVKDLIKYQLKESLTYFQLSASMTPTEKEARLLDKVLKKVSQTCGNIEHLALKISLRKERSFAFPPEAGWSFGPNLKTLEFIAGHQFARGILKMIDTTKLETFISGYIYNSSFLTLIPENNFPNLKEISVDGIDDEGLSALETLPSNIALQTLVLDEILDDLNEANVSQSLSNILGKFSQTLVSLTVDVRGGNVVLPRFENLEILYLYYDEETRLIFPKNFLYSAHFPKLKSLTLKSKKISGCWGWWAYSLSNYTKAEALSQWGLNEGLFNSFITNGQVCSTLLELDIPHCPPEEKGKNKEYSGRLKGMRTLFPNVKGKWIKAGK